MDVLLLNMDKKRTFKKLERKRNTLADRIFKLINKQMKKKERALFAVKLFTSHQVLAALVLAALGNTNPVIVSNNQLHIVFR